MLSQTKRALEDFDNQHDFERMAADILNALGYPLVDPQAPAGGSDLGKDIKFRDGDAPGIAFVTLDKNISQKFQSDLAKQPTSQGLIALFCNVTVSPATKNAFAESALAKGYRLDVFDLEGLRSLLDASLKDIRRRYLHLDDEKAARLRSEVKKLLRFPDAVVAESSPPTRTEDMLANVLPRRLFELAMNYDEEVILELPNVGKALHEHLTGYYQFRQKVLKLEHDLLVRIGQKVFVRFAHGWNMYLQYVIQRFGGLSEEEIPKYGDYLNYGITWKDTERVYTELAGDPEVMAAWTELSGLYESLIQGVVKIKERA
jgi:hypothetical protein